MEIVNNLLGYKKLNIVQNTEWFCFSIDSVILARESTINPSTKIIVDFCTGNAPVPLILSTRTKAKIYGIEIQDEIYKISKKSVDINNLNNQITILNQDVKDCFSTFNNESVDLVTCNPPYFKKSKTNDNSIKSIARHEILINLEEIIISAKKILKNKGRFSIIHDASRVGELIYLLEKYNFGIKKIKPIYAKKTDEKATIIFIEATKNTNSSVHILKPLYLHRSNGEYSNEVKKMFK